MTDNILVIKALYLEQNQVQEIFADLFINK